MAIKYDDGLEQELNRIEKMSEKDEKYYQQDGLLAYMFNMGNNDCFEYALIDENEKIIHYIILHGILNREEIEIDAKYIPDFDF